jgi:hypothetical protein
MRVTGMNKVYNGEETENRDMLPVFQKKRSKSGLYPYCKVFSTRRQNPLLSTSKTFNF